MVYLTKVILGICPNLPEKKLNIGNMLKYSFPLFNFPNLYLGNLYIKVWNSKVSFIAWLPADLFITSWFVHLPKNL